MFHLVISSFTFQGVDIPLASKILEYNLERYPDSVFFLFGAGRLGLIRVSSVYVFVEEWTSLALSFGRSVGRSSVLRFAIWALGFGP